MSTLGSDLAKLSTRRARKSRSSSSAKGEEFRSASRSSVDPAASNIRSGIAALLRGERRTVEPSHERTSGRSDATDALVQLLGARRYEVEGKEVLAVVRSVDHLLPHVDLAREMQSALQELPRVDTDRPFRALAPLARTASLEDIVVMDLETAGLWGCPIFLVGLLVQREGRLTTWQFLARHYGEEGLILRAAESFLDSCEHLVTFNGKTFDVPCWAERARFHGIESRVRRVRHVDLLHPARKLYRDRLPNCRLQTLERSVVGIQREGDIPSAQIPEVFHRFATTGDVSRLSAVLHHSRVDLVTTAKLLAHVLTDAADWVLPEPVQ